MLVFLKWLCSNPNIIYLSMFLPSGLSGEGNGNPLQYSCLENPRDRGAWWAAVCGIAQSWTWLSNWTELKKPIFSTHFYLGVRLLAWLLSPPFDSHFSPPGRLYLLPLPSLLYPTLWISLCILGCGEHVENWLLAGSVSLLLIPPFLLLVTSVSFLPLILSV